MKSQYKKLLLVSLILAASCTNSKFACTDEGFTGWPKSKEDFGYMPIGFFAKQLNQSQISSDKKKLREQIASYEIGNPIFSESVYRGFRRDLKPNFSQFSSVENFNSQNANSNFRIPIDNLKVNLVAGSAIWNDPIFNEYRKQKFDITKLEFCDKCATESQVSIFFFCNFDPDFKKICIEEMYRVNQKANFTSPTNEIRISSLTENFRRSLSDYIDLSLNLLSSHQFYQSQKTTNLKDENTDQKTKAKGLSFLFYGVGNDFDERKIQRKNKRPVLYFGSQINIEYENQDNRVICILSGSPNAEENIVQIEACIRRAIDSKKPLGFSNLTLPIVDAWQLEIMKNNKSQSIKSLIQCN